MLDDSYKQVLFKPVYKPANHGGQIREYQLEEKGTDLLRLAGEDEVVPGEDKYYMKDPLKSNVFYRTSFDPIVEWDSILEFITTKKLYVRNQKPNSHSSGKPPANRGPGTMQSTLF